MHEEENINTRPHPSDDFFIEPLPVLSLPWKAAAGSDAQQQLPIHPITGEIWYCFSHILFYTLSSLNLTRARTLRKLIFHPLFHHFINGGNKMPCPSNERENARMLWPSVVPEEYDSNLLRLDMIFCRRLGRESTEHNDPDTAPMDVAGVYALGQTVNTFLSYADQHWSALWSFHLEPRIALNDPLRLAFESFSSSYVASFGRYRGALASKLADIVAAKHVLSNFEQLCVEDSKGKGKDEGEDEAKGEINDDINLQLHALLPLQDRVKSQFQTPFYAGIRTDVNDRPGRAQAMAGTDLGPFPPAYHAASMPKRPVPLVFFTHDKTSYAALPEDSFKIAVLDGDINSALWTRLKSTIPTLLATIPESRQAQPQSQAQAHAQSQQPQSKPNVLLVDEFAAVQEQGDKLLDLLDKDLTRRAKRKAKTEKRQKARAAKDAAKAVVKRRGVGRPLTGEAAQLRSVLAADQVVRDQPAAAVNADDDDDGADPDDDAAANNNNNNNNNKKKKKQRKQGGGRNRVRFHQDVNIWQDDKVVTVRMEG